MISFAVQAHPTRSVAAAALAARIGGTVVWDPEPAASPSTWRTFRRLLEETPPEATHRLQIQDDAIVCPGFADAVRAAVRARPDRLLVFFVGLNQRNYTPRVLNACARDESWAVLQGGGWLPTVCTCWPVELAAQLLHHVDLQRWPRAFNADDEIVARFLTAKGLPALASVPSLVEHEDTSPSMMGKRGGNGARRAACWIGECQGCAAEIDWTTGPS